MSLRATIEGAIREEYAAEAAAKGHERNYEKLYVRRDGTAHWSEFTDQHSGLIDGQADGFTEVPYLIRVGTGSIACNCDWCVAGETPDADQEELDEIATRMERALGEIPVGYFDDEDK